MFDLLCAKPIESCVEFLERQAKSLDLTYNVYRLFEINTPIVVISWVGENPTLPSIALNSHMDVVPAYSELWSHPPFAAHIDENGRLYARGSQDTKAIGMQYLAAIRELKKSGVIKFKRTVHVTFVPDEEIGGTYGMKQFVQHDAFKALNIGFILDEGYMSEDDTYRIYYGERSNWSMFYFIIIKLFKLKFSLPIHSCFPLRIDFKSHWAHRAWIREFQKYRGRKTKDSAGKTV